MNGEKNSTAFHHADVANRRLDGIPQTAFVIFARRNCFHLRSMDVIVQVWTLTATTVTLN